MSARRFQARLFLARAAPGTGEFLVITLAFVIFIAGITVSP